MGRRLNPRKTNGNAASAGLLHRAGGGGGVLSFLLQEVMVMNAHNKLKSIALLKSLEPNVVIVMIICF